MTPSTTTANQQIARAAGTVMAAFVLSNLTGLVRQILVSRAFGTQVEMDAFNAASFLPTLLFTLVAGGALASAFVPTYTGFLTKEDPKNAWKLASAILNLVTLALTGFAILAAIFAPQVVRYGIYVLKPDLNPEMAALTIDLLRILLLSPILFGISGLFMGVLNANQVFLLPALAPSMYWLGMIFGVLVLSPRWGIYGLAWGAVIGAGLHMGVQLPAILRLGWQYTLRLGLEYPAVREVGRLMAPRLLGVAVVQLNFWLNIILASAQPEGSLTAIQVAFAVMTMPQVVIAQAIAIAALPTFSAQVARGDLGDMRQSLAATLRGVILLSLPASLGLILLREPVIVLLFQRGEFTARSTELVAWALLWYSAGLVGHSVVEVVSRSFYALHDTKMPVFVGAAAMGLNLIFSVAFSALFARLGLMPHGGLALANSLATGLEMVGLLFLMRKRLGGLEGGEMLTGVGQAALATLAMSAALMLWLIWMAGQPAWLVAIGGIGLGGTVYGVMMFLLRVREAHLLAQAVKRTGSSLLP